MTQWGFSLPDRDDPFWAETAEPMDGELERMWEHEARGRLVDYHNQHPEVLAYIEGCKRGHRINVLLSQKRFTRERRGSNGG